MQPNRRSRAANHRLGVVPAGLLLVGLAAPLASAGFVEPEVVALHVLPDGTVPGSFGWAVSELNDIDGDGAMDLIIGTPNNSDGGNLAGKTLVYSGRSGALIWEFNGAAGDNHGYAIADAGDTDMDGTPDIVVGAIGNGPGHAYIYSGADGTLLHTIPGEANGDSFGSAVAGAGDVDGDGYDDVLIGAEFNDAAGAGSGRAYLFSGEDASLIRTLEAEDAGDFFGSATASAGDVHDDDVPDQIVGARNAGPATRGRVYVFSGADGTLLRGPFDPDATGGALGYFFVGGVGDVDGDAVPDIYGGDFSDSTLGAQTGKAYVWSGADGTRLHTFTGVAANDGLGPGRGAGDVNRDGHADIIACSWINDEGAFNGGKATIYSGRDGTVLRTITSTNTGETFGFDGVGVGDVNGDGEIDFLISGASHNVTYVIAGVATCPADLDGDLTVGLGDLSILLGNYGQADGAEREDGDLDGDGAVGLGDLSILLAIFGSDCP